MKGKSTLANLLSHNLTRDALTAVAMGSNLLLYDAVTSNFVSCVALTYSQCDLHSVTVYFFFLSTSLKRLTKPLTNLPE